MDNVRWMIEQWRDGTWKATEWAPGSRQIVRASIDELLDAVKLEIGLTLEGDVR
jgi:hypothetical protein